ncbi:hypothetical protein ABOM_004229 [Aspergillus bombycis]|uniref:Uncharacterized protein n=1 Tax=Aspergillus bombycis TaxID=109264 RepID=A0A1F8A765_9EURO|nr:hypothetical protein ABOM_004229 [Aspergillus bombycis]OGM47531.1 hypothetical protein ABOM_004229 [Aspergillus bombycis]
MQFWLDWALWQKLSFVLAGLLVLVLIYSLCVLFYNRWATRKHAAADAHQKTIHDAEQCPMLSETNEVPFGARALERGVLVEGIWTPGQVSPIESNTPTRHDSAGLALTQLPPNPTSMVQRPSQTYMRVSLSGQSSPRWAPTVSDIRAESSDGLYPNTLHANKSLQSDVQLVGNSHEIVDSDVARSKLRLSSRGSWISKPFDKRMPAAEGAHPRTSSEEFRRRISKLFDENVQARPIEMFQLQSDSSESVDGHQKELIPDPSMHRPNHEIH